MDKQTTHLHTNRSQHRHSSQIYKHTTHSQIQQFGISTFKTSGKHFIKRHYIPQQIFHHLLNHQSQEFAKHFSSYKILMLNFYSLYLCLPHCLSPFSLTVCLSVSLSLTLSLGAMPDAGFDETWLTGQGDGPLEARICSDEGTSIECELFDFGVSSKLAKVVEESSSLSSHGSFSRNFAAEGELLKRSFSD